MKHTKYMRSILSLIMLLSVTILTSVCVAKPADVNNSIAWVYRDKIRMGWSPSDLKQYSLMAKAGMNAVMPRYELDVSVDYDSSNADTPLSENDAKIISAIRDSSRQAKQTGLHYFHSLNLAAQAQTWRVGFQNNPARYNDGKLPSPVDPVYWNRVIMNRVSRVLDLLKDKKKYALDAIIIDPEMYSLGGGLPGNPDYGKYAFETFLQETKRELPGDDINNVASREKWIEQQGLKKEYEQWQFNRIEGFGRELEKMVHQRRPSLILGYIIYEDKMWFHAMAAGLSTPQHPVFIGPENTYSGVMDERMAAYFQQIRNDVKVPTMLVPGIMMGLVHGQIPHEFLKVVSGNVYQRCQFSEGYWVYAVYNFGDTKEEQAPFYSALKKIDDALDQQAKTGKVVNLKAEPIPVPKPPGFAQLLKDASDWKPVPARTPQADRPYAPAKLRGSFALLFWPQKGKSVELPLTALRLGAYLDQLDVTLFDQEGNIILKELSPIGRALKVKSPPATEKVIGGVVGAGWNAFLIGSANCPMMIVPQDFLTVNAQRSFAGRFYFYVPANCTSFKIALQGTAGEYADYTVYDAANHTVLTLKQLKKTRTEEIKVTKAGVWCIDVDNVVDDAGVKLEGIPNVFALRPQDIMIPKGSFTK